MTTKKIVISSVLALLISLQAKAELVPQDQNLFERTHHRLNLVQQGFSFYYYTQADRIQILKDLFRSIELDYASLKLKEKNLHINFDQIQKDALAVEASIADTNIDLEQAVSNLDFLDRSRKIIALFQDTHFSINAVIEPNPIVLPFIITKAEGKYVVTGIYRKLMNYLTETVPAFSGITLGTEVVSIDGKPVAEAARALEPFINASSKAFLEQEALNGLTIRDFSFPDNPYCIVAFRKKDGTLNTLKFPWFHKRPARPDQALFFKEANFRGYDDLRLTWDANAKKWNTTGIGLENGDATNSLPELNSQEIFVDGNGKPVVKTGYILTDGRAFGVMQINSFIEATVIDNAKKQQHFLQVLKEFIKALEAQSVPLILDLRSNPGGNGTYPPALLSMLTEKGKTYSGYSSAFRLSRNIIQILDEDMGHLTMPEEMNGLTIEQTAQIIRESREKREYYSSAFSEGDITVDPEVGGYSQKVVALISPQCVSSCDITAFLLKT